MELSEFFSAHSKAALGFSGGVDSAYLLYAAVKAGANVQPYFIKTAFQPAFELEDAQRLARELGVSLRIIQLDILSDTAAATNPADRCYHCKKRLFGALKKQALADGYTLLLDGTNASDDLTDRPGFRALEELEVKSPLRECGLTKAEIRQLSLKAGLFTWCKPAYACLATRIPRGNEITLELLQKVENGENALFQLGFSDLRVRLFHGAARIQLPDGQLQTAIEKREAIMEALRPWFDTVLLDLNGRN